MINCDLTMGWNDRACASSIGGIKKAVTVPIDEIDYDTYTITDNELTAMSLIGGSTGGYEYTLNRDLSSYTAAPSRSENGSVLTPITLNIVLLNDTKALRSELMTLARKTCVWFVQKSDGTWVCLGLLDGLQMGADSEGGSGVAKTDRNGYSLNFTGSEIWEVPDVDETVVTGLTAAGSAS
jgi:hypothetical protein